MIREGYAAKRRRLGVPGGNKAPLGTVLDGRTITVDEEGMAIVRRVYEFAAGGRTDREVAAATGLAPTHVAEVLTSPFYAGRLRTGEPSALAWSWAVPSTARRCCRAHAGRPSCTCSPMPSPRPSPHRAGAL